MITIIRTKSASSVRKGDSLITDKALAISTLEGVILDGSEEPIATRTVGQVKVGRKNTEILDENGKSFFYAASETIVAVISEEKTQEERDAERDAFVRAELTKIVETGIVEFAPANLFARALKNRDGKGDRHEHALVFNTMDYLFVGQAKFDILSAVHALYTGEDRPTKGDIFRSFALVLASQLEPTRRNSRVLSRSTSHTSNLAEDVMVEVATEYLDGLYSRSLRQAVYQIWADRESL